MTTPIGKVFISHASNDKAFVDRLAADLASRSVPVWYDKLDIPIGASIPGAINDGIASAKYFLIVLSPDSVRSRWVQEELNAALIRQVAAGGTFLLPVMHKDCAVPPLVAHRRYADFRKDYDAGLTDLLSVFGKDATVAASLGNQKLYPWPNTDQPDNTLCYLHSTRFDKFFRMACDLAWTADTAIDHIVDALALPWTKEVSQLGMRWSFSYGLVLGDNELSLSTTLADAGVVEGSILRLNISGTYEDLFENELKSMWDGKKMYEITGAMRREQELRHAIAARGTLTRQRLKELADACFVHV